MKVNCNFIHQQVLLKTENVVFKRENISPQVKNNLTNAVLDFFREIFRTLLKDIKIPEQKKVYSLENSKENSNMSLNF